MHNVVFGLDPEFVIESQGKILSALPIIKGRKGTEIPLSHGSVLSDNVNIEVNVNPSTDIHELMSNFGSVIKETHNLLQEKVPSRLLAISSLHYDPDQLLHAEALVFGCNPDYNPYYMDVNIIDPNAAGDTLRTTGAHIHLGDNGHVLHRVLREFDLKMKVVKAMDLFVGLPLVFMDKDQSSPKRRSLYGVAGAHRETPYGVEYRTPSSYYLRDADIFNLIFDMTQFAAEFTAVDNVDYWVDFIGVEELQRMINQSDVKCCKNAYFDLFGGFIPESILNRVKGYVNKTELKNDISSYWCQRE